MNFALTETQVFKDLDSSAIQDVQRHAHMRTVGSGQLIVRQGDPALAFYMVRSGHAKISQVTPDGHQVSIRYIGPGEEFGLVAVLSGFDYPASVQAVDECELMVWEGELLAQLMERYSRIGFNALRILAQQNQGLQRRYQELLTERVEQRLAQTILRLARKAGRVTGEGTWIDIALSREDLAEMVGTDIYTTSRIMSRWTQEGLLHTERKSLLLLRTAALEQIAAPP